MRDVFRGPPASTQPPSAPMVYLGDSEGNLFELTDGQIG